MTGKSLEQIMELIGKLHAKAVSAHEIGSTAEAEIFADKVQELLAKHKLSMADVDAETLDKDDRLEHNYVGVEEWTAAGLDRPDKAAGWLYDLASIVANAHYCKMVFYKRNGFSFIGRHTDRVVTQYMFLELAKFAMQECKPARSKAARESVKQYGYQNIPDFKNSFYRGFVSRIRDRYFQQQMRQNKESKQYALVRTKSMEEVSKYMDDTMKTKKAPMPHSSGHNQDAYSKGHAAGGKANLQPNVIAAKNAASPNKKLGGAK